MSISQYWLARWLDNNEINHDWEIDHALNSAGPLRDLTDRIQQGNADLNSGAA